MLVRLACRAAAIVAALAATTAIASAASTPPVENGVAARGQSWLRLIHAQEAWRVSDGDPSVRVAVIDTGIDYDHPVLHGRMVAGVDLGDGDADPMDYAAYSHGTAVAGIVATTCPRCSLLGIKISGEKEGNGSAIGARAIRWAVAHGARVINLSSSWVPSPGMDAAVSDAWQRGAVVVASAGNGDDWEAVYPAAFAPTVSVGAADERSGTRLLYSAFGPFLDIVAPSPTHSTGVGTSYAPFGGTSSATALVSGALGLLFSARPKLTAAQAVAELKATAVDPGPLGRDDDYGAGRVDLARLLRGSHRTGPATRCSFPSARPGGARALRSVTFVSSCGGTFDVYTAFADGSGARRVTSGPTLDGYPGLSPDGRWIAFLRGPWTERGLYVMPSTGGNARRVAYITTPVSSPTWSPDGRTLAFVGLDARFRTGVYTVHTDGTGLHKVSLPFFSAMQVSWSPDGRHFAVSGGRFDGLWLMTAEGEPVRRLTTPARGWGDVDPAWSPDSRTIVFARRGIESGGIFRVGVDGKHLSRLTRDASDSRSPAWSAGAILFSARYGRTADLFSIRADGTGLHRVLRTPASEVQVAALASGPASPGKP